MSDNNLSQRLIESQRLLGISQMLTSATELPVVLQEIVDAAVSLIKHADTAVLHLLNEEGNMLEAAAIAPPQIKDSKTLQITASIPLGQHNRQSRMSFKAGEGIAGLVLQTRQEYQHCKCAR